MRTIICALAAFLCLSAVARAEDPPDYIGAAKTAMIETALAASPQSGSKCGPKRVEFRQWWELENNATSRITGVFAAGEADRDECVARVAKGWSDVEACSILVHELIHLDRVPSAQEHEETGIMQKTVTIWPACRTRMVPVTSRYFAGLDTGAGYAACRFIAKDQGDRVYRCGRRTAIISLNFAGHFLGSRTLG